MITPNQRSFTMPTQTQTRPGTVPVIPVNRYDIEPDDIEEIEDMSPELYEELEEEFEEARRQIAAGGLRPMTVNELAEKYGLRRK